MTDALIRLFRPGARAGRAVPLLSALLLLVAAAAFWQAKWISDDGHIYLAYVKTLLAHGELAFNTGERVDGATGFLWLLLLLGAAGVAQAWPGLTPEQAALGLSLALSLAAVALPLVRRPGPVAIALVAALVAPQFVRSFATSGLETPLILLTLTALHLGRGRLWRAALLGALPFVRPELALVSAIYAPSVLRGGVASGLAAAAAAGLGLAGLRWALFGGVLPNTAFAKLGLDSHWNGPAYAAEFALSYPHLALLAVAAGATAWALGPAGLRHAAPAAGPPALAAVLLAANAVATGGDFMHGRFFLPGYALALLALLELATRAFDAPVERPRARAALAAALLVAPPVAALGASHAGAQPGHLWRGVMDEAAAYRARDPGLHAWQAPAVDPWAADGRRLAALARHVGREVGVARGGIGQIRSHSAAAQVYIFDLLALTQVEGTLFDQAGRWDRPGHGSALPWAVIYTAPRVTLFPPPDAGLARLLAFTFEGQPFTLGDLQEIPAYVAAGLLDANTAERVEARVAAILDARPTDTEALLHLHERYPADGPHRQRIEALANAAAARRGTYLAWAESVRPILARAREITRGARPALPARYALLWETGAARPLRRPFALRRHVALDRPDCALPPDLWILPPGARIEGSRLRIPGPFPASLRLGAKALARRCGAVTELALLVRPVGSEGGPLGRYRLQGTVRSYYGPDRFRPQPELRATVAPGEALVLTLESGADAVTIELQAFAGPAH